ncbi:MAG: hypothetical protein ACTSYA_04460 [Candidatus Kariarchaeaceae archaeon]
MSNAKQPIKNQAILLTGVLKVIEVAPYSLSFLKRIDWEEYSRENDFNKALEPLLSHSSVKEMIKTTNNWTAQHENLSYRIHQYAVINGKKKSKCRKSEREELRELIKKVNVTLKRKDLEKNHF